MMKMSNDLNIPKELPSYLLIFFLFNDLSVDKSTLLCINFTTYVVTYINKTCILSNFSLSCRFYKPTVRGMALGSA